jgi:hypothetical protein
MTAEPDEDALAWKGDEPVEPTKVLVEDEPAKPGTPSLLLITYGVLGGVYLIYTIGWIITIQRLNGIRNGSTELLSEIMFQLGEFLAIASPALWLATVFLVTRDRKPILRLLGLLIGLVAVLPWPFVLGAWL